MGAWLVMRMESSSRPTTAGSVGSRSMRWAAAIAEGWFAVLQIGIAHFVLRALVSMGQPLPMLARVTAWGAALVALVVAWLLPRAGRRTWLAAAAFATLTFAVAILGVVRSALVQRWPGAPALWAYGFIVLRFGPQALILFLAARALASPPTSLRVPDAALSGDTLASHPAEGHDTRS